MRILHLGKYYPPASGGMETHLQTLAHAQARAGAQVEVLCAAHQSADGVDVTDRPWGRAASSVEHDGPIRVARVGRWGQAARFDLAPGLLPALRDRSRDAEIVHVHTPNPLMLLGMLALPATTPVVVTHHSDVIRQRLLGTLFRPFEAAAYRRARLLLATSEAYARGSEVLRSFAGKVEALPLGLELQPYLEPSEAARSEAERLRRQARGPIWLGVGRLVYYKGFDLAVRALPSLPGELWLIGSGPERAALEQLARAHRVHERVRFLGRVDDTGLTAAYLAATALLFPSNARSEAFGLVQVEAMAAGCPVINTEIPGSGASWVSPHGVSGLTVPMNDPAALATAALRLLDEPGTRARLAEGGRQRARAEFAADRMAARSLELYRRALGESVLPLARPASEAVQAGERRKLS